MSNTKSRSPVLSWIAFLATLAVVALCLRLSWWQLELSLIHISEPTRPY